MTSWTADELMLVEFPEPRWAVPGLLAEGCNLLAGAPKLGKSWLALNLSVAIASGGKALGSIEVDRGEVLYLALEDTGRRLQSRMRMVLQGATAPRALTLGTECETLATGGVERIEKWITAHSDSRLVVVDVFTKVRGRTANQANLYEADYAAMGMLKGIADTYGVAVLVVHHTRKGASEDFLDTVSGTQGIAGAADAVLVLSRSRGAAGAVLHVTGRDVEETDHALDFDSHAGTWRLLAGPASDYELGDTRRRIVHHLRDGGPASPKAIAEALSLNYESVKKSCRRMADDGQLDTDGAGIYFVPETPVPPVPGVPDVGFSFELRDTGDAGDTPSGDGET